MNVFMEEPPASKLTAMHFYAWRNGLKTGMYYLRSRLRATPQKFTIEPMQDSGTCNRNRECVMCSA